MHHDLAVTLMDSPGYFVLILYYASLLSSFLGPYPHMSKILSNQHLITNEIKGLKFCNSAQSSFDAQTNRQFAKKSLQPTHTYYYFYSIFNYKVR